MYSLEEIMKINSKINENENYIIDKKADILIKKDKLAKSLLKNPPKFSKENYKQIRKWVLQLVDLIY
jgi:hypothetical protein